MDIQVTIFPFSCASKITQEREMEVVISRVDASSISYEVFFYGIDATVRVRNLPISYIDANIISKMRKGKKLPCHWRTIADSYSNLLLYPWPET